MAKETLRESRENLKNTLDCIDSSQSKLEFLRGKYEEMGEKTGGESDTNRRHILEELIRERKEESKLMAKKHLEARWSELYSHYLEALGKTLEQIGTEAFKKMHKNKERRKGLSGEEFVKKLHTIMEEEPEKETEVSKTASLEERAEMKDVEKDFPEEGKLPMELSYANFDVENEVARDEKEFQELVEAENASA